MNQSRSNALSSFVEAYKNSDYNVLKYVLSGSCRPPLSDPDTHPNLLIRETLSVASKSGKSLQGYLEAALPNLLNETMMQFNQCEKKTEAVKLYENIVPYLEALLNLTTAVPRNKIIWEALLNAERYFRPLSQINYPKVPEHQISPDQEQPLQLSKNTRFLLIDSLAYHQNDRSLEAAFKQFLCNSTNADNLFKSAWHGILWLPPAEKDADPQDYIPISEISEVLLLVDNSLKKASSENHGQLLTFMLREMQNNFIWVSESFWIDELDLTEMLTSGSIVLIQTLLGIWPQEITNIIEERSEPSVKEHLLKIDSMEIRCSVKEVDQYSDFILSEIEKAQECFIIVSDTLNAKVYCQQKIIDAVIKKMDDGVVFKFLCGKYILVEHEKHEFIETIFREKYKSMAIFYSRNDRAPIFHYKIVDHKRVIVEALHKIGVKKRQYWMTDNDLVAKLLNNKFDFCVSEPVNKRVDSLSDYIFVPKFPKSYERIYKEALKNSDIELALVNPEKSIKRILKNELTRQQYFQLLPHRG